MTAISHPEFNSQTEGLSVARAFADGIRGKTIIVTGVNRGGIGFSTAEAFASQSPAHLILAGRNPAKLQECISSLNAAYPGIDCQSLIVDLASQQSVRDAAKELLSRSDIPAIDIMVNSAGIMMLPERTLVAAADGTAGIELTFATNHIGHFLLTCLIMPKLIKSSSSGGARIVNVSSGSPMFAKMRWSDLTFEKINADLPETEQPDYDLHRVWGTADPGQESYIPLEAYNQSKVANVLFSIAANKRLYEKYGVLSVAVHPGVITTELGRNGGPRMAAVVKAMAEQGVFTYKTLGAGASTSLVAALDPKLGPGGDRREEEEEEEDGKRGGRRSENHGVYLVDCQISDQAHPLAVSSVEAEKLWTLSEELVGEKFAW